MIRFDFDDRYQDEPLVGKAISHREAVVVSLVVHGAIALLLFLAPAIPGFRRTPEELQALFERQQRQPKPQEDRTFVFVQPRVDLEAPRPPVRGEASDKDRIASAPERAEKPTSPLPFARGNSRERVEAPPTPPPQRARGPESAAPPSPGDAVQPPPQPAGREAQRLPPSENGLTLPREGAPQPPPPRAASGALGEALRNLQRYVQNESFDNRSGDSRKYGPFLQFDTKGVEFGPWVRRFVAQVKRNWFIPDAAFFARGHVVLQFNVHKDGRITDVAIVAPSEVEGFNNASANAILASNPTEPLPPEYPTDKAFFTVTFFYNEEPQ